MVRLDLLVSHSHMILTVHSGKSWDKPTSSIIDGGWNYFLCTQFRFSAMTHVLQSADIFPLVFFCLFCKQVTSFCEFRQSRLVFCLYLWLKHLSPWQCLGLSCTPLSLFLSLSLSLQTCLLPPRDFHATLYMIYVQQPECAWGLDFWTTGEVLGHVLNLNCNNLLHLTTHGLYIALNRVSWNNFDN